MRLRVEREISREEVGVLFAMGCVEGRDFIVCGRFNFKPGDLINGEPLGYTFDQCEALLDRPSRAAFLLSPAGEDVLDEDELADRSDE